METGFCLFPQSQLLTAGSWGDGGGEEAADDQECASSAQPQGGVFSLAFVLFFSTPAPIPTPGLPGVNPEVGYCPPEQEHLPSTLLPAGHPPLAEQLGKPLLQRFGPAAQILLQLLAPPLSILPCLLRALQPGQRNHSCIRQGSEL